MNKKFFILILLTIFMPTVVLAHSGRTDSNGCHYCRTNCEKYGLSNGEYHCHNGSSTSSSSSNSNSDSSSYTNTSETTTTTRYITTTQKPKSNDNTLKEIIIDGENVNVEESINYVTKNESVDIEVLTNDDKATYKIINEYNLSIGENEVIVEVKAEDRTIKNYIINVIREVILSSNTGIKVYINEEEVSFNNYEAIVYVDNSDIKFDLDYDLEDEKSKVEIEEINELKVGNNNLEIKVIAEDGSEQIYNIIISRASKSEDVISTILSCGIIGGIGYGIYYLVKKGKKNIKSNENK